MCSTFFSNLSDVYICFVFSWALLSKIDCCVVGFLDFLTFQVVLIKLESGVQKNNLSSFDLGLISLGYRGTFLYTRLVFVA